MANNETVYESDDGDIRVEVVAESAILQTLAVEVAARRVDKAFDRAYQGLRKEVRVKGFRPGKTPRAVLERLYSASLPEEIERQLVGETLPVALELASVEPVVEPGIEAERPGPKEVFRYKARIEQKPVIELPETHGLPAKRPPVIVGDDEVMKQLEVLRERNAPVVEEPDGTLAATGHFLTIDFVGRVDGEAFEGGTAKGHELELGSGQLMPGFEDQLIGAVAGDDRQVDVQFPDDYGNETLRGRAAVFDVHIDAVKRREQVELDDEFAKDLGDFDTLDELRDRIRSDLSAQRAKAADSVLRTSVMDSLLERTEFEVPPGIVERQLQHQLSSFRREYEQHVPEDVLEAQLTRMAEEGRGVAERRVREAFVLEAVAEAEGIVANDTEVDERLDQMAEGRGMPPAQLRKLAKEQGWREAIRSELVDKKTLDLLAEQAEIESVVDEDTP